MDISKESGERGEAGERGPKGDHGQPGVRGATGATGATAYFRRSQTLVLFGFIVLAFVLLAWRTEINANNLLNQQHNGCLIRKESVLKFNRQQVELTKIEQRNKFINEDIRQARIKVYQEGALVVPDCESIK